MIVLFPDDTEIAAQLTYWAARRIWGGREGVWRTIADASRCMAVLDGDELLAVMVYHNWDPQAGVIEISGASASPRWWTRETMKKLYWYPFDHVGCQMVVHRTGADNKRVNRIMEWLGAKPHRIERLRGYGQDEIVWTLTIEDWRSHVGTILKGQCAQAA